MISNERAVLRAQDAGPVGRGASIQAAQPFRGLPIVIGGNAGQAYGLAPPVPKASSGRRHPGRSKGEIIKCACLSASDLLAGKQSGETAADRTAVPQPRTR